MDQKALAALLFPDVTETPEDLEARYPARDLPEGAVVTRMAPSPTGFVHLGNLVRALSLSVWRTSPAACCSSAWRIQRQARGAGRRGGAHQHAEALWHPL